MKGIRTPSMYRGETFRENLEELLPEGTIGDLQMPFYCNSVCLENGGSVFWGTPGTGEVSVVDAVYASCCLPGIFEPFQWEDKHFMDGGIVDPLPLRFAKTLQPELIIAVDLTVKATFKDPNYKNRLASTMMRAFQPATENRSRLPSGQRTVRDAPSAATPRGIPKCARGSWLLR